MEIMKTNQNQWKPIKPIKPNKPQWKPMKTNTKQRKPIKPIQNQYGTNQNQ